MELNILGSGDGKSSSSSAGGCGTCATGGCGTCGSTAVAAPPVARPSRRDLVRATLAASAGVAMTRFASAQTPAASAAQPAPAPPPMADTLAVVQKSKGPILTVLDEFYKMGPGPSSSH